MSEKNWEALRKPFPPEQIEKLKKFKNGPALDYIGHATITERLCEVDPEWSIDFAYHDANGMPVIDHKNGMAYFKMTVFGVTRICVGDTGGKDLTANGHKEMIGDAIRNGAMRFGVGTYLWSKSEEAGVRKNYPDWQAEIDSHTDADALAQMMRNWQARGGLNAEISKYAHERISMLKKNVVEGEIIDAG